MTWLVSCAAENKVGGFWSSSSSEFCKVAHETSEEEEEEEDLYKIIKLNMK